MSRFESWRQRFDQHLARRLPNENHPPGRLHQAMRYSALLGGKRVRPLLVYLGGQALDVSPDKLDDAAVAVELIHAYSLIHDDLPAMDDDALRRGQPTCHIAFDEATAILAGDALQALAFEVLLANEQLEPSCRARMSLALARACGSLGMAGGQALDLAATGKQLDLEALETMHRLKTGALIQASVTLPALAAENLPLAQRDALARFGDHLGLAFQVRDDILDEVGETRTLGKQAGADRALGKATYPALLGLEQAQDHLQMHYRKALSALEPFGPEADGLRELARAVVVRDH